jgi:hypothetical protein
MPGMFSSREAIPLGFSTFSASALVAASAGTALAAFLGALEAGRNGWGNHGGTETIGKCVFLTSNDGFFLLGYHIIFNMCLKTSKHCTILISTYFN